MKTEKKFARAYNQKRCRCSQQQVCFSNAQCTQTESKSNCKFVARLVVWLYGYSAIHSAWSQPVRQYCQFDFKTYSTRMCNCGWFFSFALEIRFERFATHVLSTRVIFCMHFEIMRRFLISNDVVYTLCSSSIITLFFCLTRSASVSKSSSRSTCFESIFRNFYVFQIGLTRQDKVDCDDAGTATVAADSALDSINLTVWTQQSRQTEKKQHLLTEWVPLLPFDATIEIKHEQISSERVRLQLPNMHVNRYRTSVSYSLTQWRTNIWNDWDVIMDMQETRCANGNDLYPNP